MPLTLADSNLLSLPMMTRGVIDTIVRESRILQLLPFTDVVGNSYVYNQELTLSTVAFYAPNDNWSEGTLTVQQKVAHLSILGGNADVDSFLERTYANVNDLRTVAIQNKAKAVAYQYCDTFINGDTGSDPNAFMGIAKLVDPTQKITAGANGAALTLDMMDQLIDKIKPGAPDLILMSRRSRRNLMKLLRGSGNLFETDVNNFGQRIEFYAGVPIAVDDNQADTQVVGTSGAVCSSIYAMKLGDNGVLGLTNGGIMTEQVGNLPDADAWRVRIKFYCSIASKYLFGLANLVGVNGS